jgi:hypothetical protein
MLEDAESLHDRGTYVGHGGEYRGLWQEVTAALRSDRNDEDPAR